MEFFSKTTFAARIAEVFRDEDHKFKAAGWPWTEYGCTNKLAALEKFGIDQLLDYFDKNQNMIGITLKDELRPIGKDARLFRPADASAFAEGMMLFHNQNAYLQNNLFRCPVFCMYQSPGPHLIQMYRRLREHGGKLYDADGTKWDANLSVALTHWLYQFRARNHNSPNRVMRYFERMMLGYSVHGGHMFRLLGNPSGHYNTTTDNCLAHCFVFAYHAWLNKMCVKEFLEGVLFYCCGDDLVWSDRTGLFTPEKISETYHSLGMFLEFTSLEPMQLEELNFVGTQYVRHPELGDMYKYNGEKFKAKLFWRRKGSTALDSVARLTSFAHLTFADQEMYEYFKNMATKEAIVVGSSADGLIRSMDRSILVAAYKRLESSRFLHFFLGGSGGLN